LAKQHNIKLNKGLGQHFLKDTEVLRKIVWAIDENLEEDIPFVEVGPGAGALTQFIYKRKGLKLIEFDTRWAELLKEKYPSLKEAIYNEDFLKMDLRTIYNSMAVIGNFPYNISSQIMFKVLDYKENVPFVLGMFQKEVGLRICSKPGNKTYGILSVLLQAFYEAEYLFDVPREAFDPPPKVVSGVLVLKRRDQLTLPCNEKFLKQIVKQAFGQRRKTLRNSLKSLIKTDEIKELSVFDLRPEALGVDGFINLTNILE
jgi:16S rRNA (adenine1518-N6/adenine1519-N6)-dimethyltransferase